MTQKATLSKEGLRVTVLVDDVIVGHCDSGERGHASCKALMDELNASDKKCDLLKKIMEDVS